MDIKQKYITVVACLTLAMATGCGTTRYGKSQQKRFAKTTIAVAGFEDRTTGENQRWNIGDGLAEQLSYDLMQTNRYNVIQQQYLRAILKEQSRKNKRPKGQSEEFSELEYLVTGTITDFGHVATSDGSIDRKLFGRSGYSVVAITLCVVDAWTGQTITCKKMIGKQGEKEDQKALYDSMALGSYAYYQTPLGKATRELLDDAVDKIVKTTENRPYQPKIASIINNQVVINGGSDRNIKVGDVYVVRTRSQRIMDPDSRDVLGHVSGQVLGQVRVTQVTKKHSIAKVIGGDGLRPGQTLYPSKIQSATGSAATSSY